VAKVLRSFW